MKKAIMLTLVALIFIATIGLNSVYAAPPQTVVSTANQYIEIISPTNDYIKTNTTYTFQYHLFNSSTGLPFTAKDNISCVFHLYALLGTHQYVSNTAAINNNIYDVGITVAAGNFTKGFYNVLVQCNTTTIGGAIKQQFEITNTGIAPATDMMVIFSYLMFIGIVALFIYLFVYSLEQFGALKFDLKDLIYNIIAYIVLLITHVFNEQYFGIASLKIIMLIFLSVGTITMIAVPMYMFLICYMKNLLTIKMGGKW